MKGQADRSVIRKPSPLTTRPRLVQVFDHKSHTSFSSQKPIRSMLATGWAITIFNFSKKFCIFFLPIKYSIFTHDISACYNHIDSSQDDKVYCSVDTSLRPAFVMIFMWRYNSSSVISCAARSVGVAQSEPHTVTDHNRGCRKPNSITVMGLRR